jgi:MerR family transcriptional regulator, light-induced transcriptional regulator
LSFNRLKPNSDNLQATLAMPHTRPQSGPGRAAPMLRSAAVARLAAMPVATLRIWEQRYGLASVEPRPGQHRLYTTQDLQRVILLRQLTQQGHAIGSLARLDEAQLQAMREAGSGLIGAGPGASALTAPRPGLRLVVVGRALSLRLQRPAVAQSLLGVAQVLRVWDSMESALQDQSVLTADLLIWHAPELQPAMLEQLALQVRQLQQAMQVSHAAIIYRFAASRLQQALRDTQILAIREPADDEALVSWLLATQNAIGAPRPQAPATQRKAVGALQPYAPRRFDDAALTLVAGLSPSLACECPTHLAQLLMQLASFEQYSAGCVNQSPQDAELHAYLQHTAGTARAMFEAALERVAIHEGLSLPGRAADTPA